MAKQIVWSIRAQNDRKEIFKYWKKRNRSNEYNKKLNNLFKEAVKLISDYPEIGKVTDDGKVRIKIVNDYFIIYEVEEEKIFLLSIWDSRQNPDRLNKVLSK